MVRGGEVLGVWQPTRKTEIRREPRAAERHGLEARATDDRDWAWSKRIGQAHEKRVTVVVFEEGIGGEEDSVAQGEAEVFGDLPIEEDIGLPAEVAAVVVELFVDGGIAVHSSEDEGISADLETTDGREAGQRKSGAADAEGHEI